RFAPGLPASRADTLDPEVETLRRRTRGADATTDSGHRPSPVPGLHRRLCRAHGAPGGRTTQKEGTRLFVGPRPAGLAPFDAHRAASRPLVPRALFSARPCAP